MVKELEKNIEEQLSQETRPFIVEFYSPTCGTCKVVMPLVEEVEQEYGDDYAFYKINVENDMKFAQKHKVNSVPTLLFIKNGQVVEQHHGNISKENIIALIKKAFENN